MSGTALLDTMARQVDEANENNLSAARKTAEGILEDARQKAVALEEETLKATAAEMDALAERWRQKAQAEAAKAELVLQNDAVRAVLDKVDGELRAIVASGTFKLVLDALLEELMAAAPVDVIAIAPPAQLDHVKDWLASNGHAKVPVEAAEDMWDGVAIQDRDRTFRISNTLSGRFARIEQQARRTCMLSLFGTEGNE